MEKKNIILQMGFFFKLMIILMNTHPGVSNIANYYNFRLFEYLNTC